MKKIVFKTDKPVALCSDHAGVDTKKAIIEFLKTEGFEVNDYGTYTSESCDYPDFAHPCAQAIEEGRSDFGIALCGTGNGISMTLNKHQAIRAALCWTPEIAKLAREHNDANILVMPARFLTVDAALEIVETYLTTPFEGGRHIRRIEKIPVKA
ncbi:MAG: ribose 5-phosphate isomerase B [Paramuribaculum sp.]|nr:ribose 5-phosphate isomerase B [Paramuribaculum sp.]